MQYNGLDVRGSFSISTISGTMAAGLAAAAPVYSIRWGTDTGAVALIKRIAMSMNSLTGFTAGVGKFELFIVRAFSASDSAGTSILPTGNSQKMRNGLQGTLFTDMRQSSTATLTAGTRTLDGAAFRHQVFAVPTTANYVILPTTEVYRGKLWGDHPLVLAHDEGIIIRATVPATGTWNFTVDLDWAEVSSIPTL